MRDILNYLSLRYINPVEAEIKIEVTVMEGSEITCTEDAHHLIKILETDTGVNFNNRGHYGYNARGGQRYRNNYNDYRRNNYRGQDCDRNRSRS